MEELILNDVLKQLKDHLLEHLRFLELRTEDMLQLTETPIVQVFHVTQPVLLVHTPLIKSPNTLLGVFPICLRVDLLVLFDDTILTNLIQIGKIIRLPLIG